MFTKDVLELARAITAKLYPWDEGSIHGDCLRAACLILQAKGVKTLILG